jgi:radical SAM superfamily enzyme YgiQ (UPF0313 family)
MRVSLIHPRLTYLASQQPLGLGYIAACLERAGHEVQFIEAVFYPTDEEVAAAVGKFGAQVVGISVMINYYSKTLSLARLLKAADPNLTIVLGGPHASTVPETFTPFADIDYVLVGEGEESFPLLATALESPENFDPCLIPGLVWNGGRADIPKATRIMNLDALPWPARHLMPMNDYQHRDYHVSFGMHGGNFNIITTRGCPNICNFCDHTVFGYRISYRSIKDVVDEIQETSRIYGIRNFDIMDDTFTLNYARVMEFCEELLRRNLNLFWCCRLRVTGVTRDMIKTMASAGCIRFSVGIESIDERVLQATQKRITIQEVMQALQWAKEFGILTIGNFMIGNLGDDHESVEKTIQFAVETDEIDLPSYVVLVPLPGTPVYDLGKERGWIRSFDWDEYRMNNKGLPLMRNEALTHEDIQELYAKAATAVRPKILRAFEELHLPRKSLYPELTGK